MTLRPATRASLPVVAAASLLLAGCGGGPPSAAPATSTAADASASGPSCPTPPPTTLTWPAGVPDDLPKPPGAVLTSSNVTDAGLTVVRFSTAGSLRNGVLYLVRTLQPAGYTLGRGDAEAAEADAPFSKGALRGVYRLVAREPCATDWLLALTTAPSASNAPLLPAPPGAASPSPLPFG